MPPSCHSLANRLIDAFPFCGVPAEKAWLNHVYSSTEENVYRTILKRKLESGRLIPIDNEGEEQNLSFALNFVTPAMLRALAPLYMQECLRDGFRDTQGRTMAWLKDSLPNHMRKLLGSDESLSAAQRTVIGHWLEGAAIFIQYDRFAKTNYEDTLSFIRQIIPDYQPFLAAPIDRLAFEIDAAFLNHSSLDLPQSPLSPEEDAHIAAEMPTLSMDSFNNMLPSLLMLGLEHKRGQPLPKTLYATALALMNPEKTSAPYSFLQRAAFSHWGEYISTQFSLTPDEFDVTACLAPLWSENIPTYRPLFPNPPEPI